MFFEWPLKTGFTVHDIIYLPYEHLVVDGDDQDLWQLWLLFSVCPPPSPGSQHSPVEAFHTAPGLTQTVVDWLSSPSPESIRNINPYKPRTQYTLTGQRHIQVLYLLEM